MGFGMIGKFMGGVGEGISKVGTAQMAEQAQSDRDARLNQYHQDAFNQITSAEQAKAKNQQEFDAMQKGLDRTATSADKAADVASHEKIADGGNKTGIIQTQMQQIGANDRNTESITADAPFKQSQVIENTEQTKKLEAERVEAGQQRDLIAKSQSQSLSPEERQRALDELNVRRQSGKSDADSLPFVFEKDAQNNLVAGDKRTGSAKRADGSLGKAPAGTKPGTYTVNGQTRRVDARGDMWGQ